MKRSEDLILFVVFPHSISINCCYLQAQEDVSKNLLLIKNMLYGTSDSEPQTDIVVAQLSQELYNSGLLVLLTQNLSRVDFEVCEWWCCILNFRLRSMWPFLFTRARRMWRKYSTTFLDDKLVRVLQLWNTFAPSQKFFSR